MKAVLKYPGAKWKIGDWIIEHFPEHKVYCEPFFGSGAVFFKKKQNRKNMVEFLRGATCGKRKCFYKS